MKEKKQSRPVLNRSLCIFNEQEHTYVSEVGVPLSGITRMISKHLFPDKYSNKIPRAIMENARIRGDRVHKDCEDGDLFGIYETAEGVSYSRLKEREGIVPIANEYLVSDNENFATKIDMIDVDVCLYDFKTTYSIDKDYLSWQLSIGAFLFELQNPGLKVNGLFGIWLRGEKAEKVPIKRVPDEEVKRLLECELNGTMFVPAIDKNEVDALSLINDDIISLSKVEEYISELVANAKELNAQKERLMKGIKAKMEEGNISKIDTERLLITIVKPSSKTRFDSAGFKRDYPDLSRKYQISQNVDSYIKVKLKGEAETLVKKTDEDE